MHATSLLGRAVAAVTLMVASQAIAQETVPIEQHKVPWTDARSRDPYVAPDGKIWFVGQGQGNYLGYFDPSTKQFERFELPARTLPHSNVVAANGIVWVAGNGNGTIVRFDPRTKEMKAIPMPEGVRDPHTMVFDGKGGMWFTSQNSNVVGHMNLATEAVRVVSTASAAPRTRPYGIIVDDKGAPWFDLFSTNKIGTIDPATMEVKTFDLPEGARPRRIARTSDGMIWYTDYARGYLGMLNPANGSVEEFRSPSGDRAQGYAMTVDDADRLWYVETGVTPNRLVAFDSKAKKFVYNTPVPGEGRNAVRHMVFDPKTRLIWYGSDLYFIGSVKVPPKVATMD